MSSFLLSAMRAVILVARASWPAGIITVHLPQWYLNTWILSSPVFCCFYPLSHCTLHSLVHSHWITQQECGTGEIHFPTVCLKSCLEFYGNALNVGQQTMFFFWFLLKIFSPSYNVSQTLQKMRNNNNSPFMSGCITSAAMRASKGRHQHPSCFEEKKRKEDAKSGFASWPRNSNVMSSYHEPVGAAGGGIGKRLESDCADGERGWRAAEP